VAYPKDPKVKLGFLYGMSACSVSYGVLLLLMDVVPTGDVLRAPAMDEIVQALPV